MLDGLQNQVVQQRNVVTKPPPHPLSQIQNVLEPPLKTRISNCIQLWRWKRDKLVGRGWWGMILQPLPFFVSVDSHTGENVTRLTLMNISGGVLGESRPTAAEKEEMKG